MTKPDSAAKKRWKAENTRNLVININRNTDAEIFQWLESLPGSYGKEVKAAIKEYIANHPDRPFWEEDETPKEYRYGMRLRGYSPGAQPKGVLRREDDQTGRYHDIIVYDRKLSADEIRAYELDEMED